MRLLAPLAAALGRPLADSERLALAVSGGPDSMALLHLAAAEFPERIAALTVDHGLRPASADEAAMVSGWCAAHGIPHATLHWQGPKPGTGVPAAARDARYALMAGWCAARGYRLLLTAHHADDQAETLLMRLGRGSGGAGLAGIRAVRDLGQGVTLVRPLLAVRRAALAAIAATGPVVDDPSNHDPRYARTAARRLLAETPWLDAGRMAAAAAHLADAAAALDWAADRAWAGNALATADTIRIDAGGLPGALQRKLLERAIKQFQPETVLRGADLSRLLARLAAGGTAALAGVRAQSTGDIWLFSRAAPRKARVVVDNRAAAVSDTRQKRAG
ncbi:tRNA lysidine(34) synthetase TilS [Sandarakinorhabdus sp. DWP1-3-1]|uniref:tRNA lysidine(34) synthetase TilS n=1 Tax=Sandarakinorhabdus sp. DWP1-3-1 TaxID=2804627 RepID=UPI003CF89DFE